MKTVAVFCPVCGHNERKTINVRARKAATRGPMVGAPPYVVRRAECLACGHRWTTYELPAEYVYSLLHVKKAVQKFAAIMQTESANA